MSAAWFCIVLFMLMLLVTAVAGCPTTWVQHRVGATPAAYGAQASSRWRTAWPAVPGGCGQPYLGRPGRTPRGANVALVATLKVAIADDSALLREGVARVLGDAGFDVVAQVGNAVELMSAISSTSPDVVVVDIRMPPTHTDEGVRAALRIRQAQPGIGGSGLSQYAEP